MGPPTGPRVWLSAATGSSTQSQTYDPTQKATQGAIGTTTQTNLARANAGTLTPGVQAQETSSANSINKMAAAGADKASQALAARGLGKSGMTGQSTLQNELAREAAQGANTASYAGMQDQMNSQNLLAALNYAFTSLGSSASGSSTGKSSQFGLNAGVAATVPGF